MKISRFSWGLIIVCLSAAVSAMAADSRAGGWGPFASLPRALPEYRAYFYNYPHAIPPDYLFRTARVFAPQEMDKSVLAALIAPRSGEAGDGAGQGVQAAGLPGKIDSFAKELLASAAEPLRDEFVVAVSTFVSLDNLYATSSFGRYLGEQFLSSLQRAGLEVVEVRKTPGLLVSPNHGEFALSRNMDEIGLVQDAQAMVVGTYKVAGAEIFINARLLRNNDNRVLASATLVLPLDRVSAALLNNERAPVSNRTALVAIRPFPEEGKIVSSPVVAAVPEKKTAKPAVKAAKINKKKGES